MIFALKALIKLIKVLNKYKNRLTVSQDKINLAIKKIIPLIVAKTCLRLSPQELKLVIALYKKMKYFLNMQKNLICNKNKI
jgi:hypothetical protein